ncbi:LamG-like jellyroll fold domain-containing protein [Marivirga salinae]|uniref:LamG-like jellyroll fold domain-containing protein n=1 Tax=Marivirga salinarum TaxID=3059078 RepID=A0AA51NBM1_9BACT|nr:LamG-like jellyroll fold domain-containing protein [Marivirga sp. BDSF4-3]WMN12009.1 LamG-like jellyroll fold domain-containing protein [Marivirga sp. BDSF4-3]
MIKYIPYLSFIVLLFSSCKPEEESLPQINANFSASDLTILEGKAVTFTDLSTNNPSAWEWDFGSENINTSTDQNPTVIFETSGVYDIKLVASNESVSDTEIKSSFITVVESLNAKFDLNDSIINQGNQIQFTDLSTGSSSNLEWTFEGGNPASSTESNPTVSYDSYGVYKVSLKVSSEFQPEGRTATKTVVVLPTNGLIAYYPFSGNAEDESDNQFNGSINGASATSDRYQQANQAFSFDGLNDYIETSNQIDENLSQGTSFSAWINISEVGSTVRIISNYNGTGIEGNCLERIGFVFGVSEDQELTIFYATNGNDYDGRKTASGKIVANQWYHVVGTWDGTFNPSGFKLYIDGVRNDQKDFEQGIVNCGGFQESENPFHIGIGHCSTGPCAPFNGAIDEVRIYNRVLNAQEILILTKN